MPLKMNGRRNEKVNITAIYVDLMKGSDKEFGEEVIRISYKIAQIIRPHFIVYAQFDTPELKDKIKGEEFCKIDKGLLIPRTWDEKFIFYASLINVNEEKMAPQKRLEEMESKYSKDPSFLKVLNGQSQMIMGLCEKVEALMQRNLGVGEVERYSFL
ncbi:unnamed protein product [marine sediment metagenome]|uniref:Uncharacterized protein n=1 Tax=marine sediment metagenome TaxID=412755 RepID=X1P5Z2_9ZZZZ